MLVLSRHREESIMVGDDVEIKVVRIRRNEIQLGITAPKSVPVYRKEVFERISEEKERNSVGYPYFYVRQGNTVAVNA
jgi:carbon storage regulator